MKAEVKVTTKAPTLMIGLRDAQRAGLIAAARVVQNAVKRELRHGYHSSLGNWGDFTTGNNLNHVTIGTPQYEADGLSIKVGTDLMYALFWEVGHHNIFTRHFERDEKWGPAYRDSRPRAIDAYTRAFSSRWRNGASGAGLGTDLSKGGAVDDSADW